MFIAVENIEAVSSGLQLVSITETKYSIFCAELKLLSLDPTALFINDAM